MAQRTIIQQLPSDVKKIRDRLSSLVKENFLDSNLRWRIHRSRFLLDLELYEKRPIHQGDDSNFTVVFGSSMINLSNVFEREIQEIIHVPGLRGNPSRQYVATPVVGPKFEGTFENYVAAVINYWQEVGDLRLQTLSQNLLDLGLTSVIRAKRLNDTQVELRVGRRLQSTENDLVSIADVGFGVSQVLPVLVALLVAKPQQFVYIEQPEIHLHPKAQHSLASMIADAANRGVRVIVETHSDLLLLGIQTLVAQRPQYLKNKDVILHWFSRHDASTQVTSRELDKEGAYGDWPEDFADVRLEAQRQYLDAADEAEMER